MVVIPYYKCTRCGRGNLRLEDMKLAGYVLSKTGRYSASWCMPCHRKNGRERAKRMRKDPEQRRRLNAATYRYRIRRRANPVHRAEDLEKARIQARLRKERRQGRHPETVRRSSQAARPPDALPKLPSAPLIARIDQRLEMTGSNETELAAIAGIPERRFYEWRNGGQARYDAVDKVLMALDLLPQDIWDEEVLASIGAV